MSDLKPRQKRQQRTRQAILDAARQIINEKGPDNLSIRAIARRIDYSPAGLYEYFGSKEEIIWAVVEQGHLRLKEYMARVDATLPATDYLVELGVAYIEFARTYPDYFIMMFTTSPEIPDEDFAYIMTDNSSFPILQTAVNRGIAEGAFQTKEGFGLMEIIFMVWAMVHGQAMLQITYLRHIPLDYTALARDIQTRMVAMLAM